MRLRAAHRKRSCVSIGVLMSDRPICKSTEHLFVPILEVSIPLLRCIHCNVFAYHETVKQLAKNRTYRLDEVDEGEKRLPVVLPYWRRVWLGLRRRFASAGPWVAGS
jgi:hypothetical protein